MKTIHAFLATLCLAAASIAAPPTSNQKPVTPSQISQPNVAYVLTNGNDSSAAIGDYTHPYLTAQAAYNALHTAWVNSGSIKPQLLYIGVANGGGVTITQDWPSQISVTGAGAPVSKLGGINARGAAASAGHAVTLYTDGTVDTGDIISDAGAGGSSTYWVTADNADCPALIGNTLAVGNYSGTISFLDATSGTMLVANQACPTPQACVPSGTFFYVAINTQNTSPLSQIQKWTSSGSLVSTSGSLGEDNCNLAIDSGTNLWTASYYDNTLWKLTSGLSVTGTFSLPGSNPHGICVGSLGDIHIAENGSGDIASFTTSGSLIGSTTAGGHISGPIGIISVVSGTTHILAVCNNGSNTVSILNESDRAWIRDITVGSSPFALANPPGTTKLVVTNQDSSSLSCVDFLSGSTYWTAPIGASPRGVVVDGSATYAYAAHFGASDVSKVRISDGAVMNAPASGGTITLRNVLTTGTVQSIGASMGVVNLTDCDTVTINADHAINMQGTKLLGNGGGGTLYDYGGNTYRAFQP